MSRRISRFGLHTFFKFDWIALGYISLLLLLLHVQKIHYMGNVVSSCTTRDGRTALASYSIVDNNAPTVVSPCESSVITVDSSEYQVLLVMSALQCYVVWCGTRREINVCV